jgi:hypothetical protein
MKIKISNATNRQLDWLVAKCEGVSITFGVHGPSGQWEMYSTNWAQGGPIIERESIELRYHAVVVAGIWYRDGIGIDECTHKAIDPTPLIAAMRCLVLSKLGEEVEVPDGLL